MRLAFALTILLLGACTDPLTPSPRPRVPGSPSAGQGAKEKTEQDASAAKPPRKSDKKDAQVPVDDDDGLDGGQRGSEPVADAGTDAGLDAAQSTDSAATVDGAPTADSAVADDPVVGHWLGEIEDAIGRDYIACVEVTQVSMAGPAGNVVYTGALDCAADLTYSATEGNVVSFGQTVTRGTGCPRGTLKLSLNANGTLNYEWYLNMGSVPDEVGVLSRVDTCPE
jgi:hypothetical protein